MKKIRESKYRLDTNCKLMQKIFKLYLDSLKIVIIYLITTCCLSDFRMLLLDWN